jgi:hypothetical protein
MSKVSDESSMSEYTNIFISRMLIYTGVCFAFIYGLSQFHINLASGFYFFPFVMVLLILEHICKAYNISSKRFLIMPVLLLLLVYYLGYSVVFLTLTGNSYEFSDLIYFVIGHFIYFIGAVYLSRLYARLRARKRNKK